MKTVLLGMNSPTGKVLEYDRANSAGGRLLKLSGMSPPVYSLCFRRMNLLATEEWSDETAFVAGRLLRPSLVKNYRSVVVLGEKVWKALDFLKIEWLESLRIENTKFYSIPHTSGRCLWYNDAKNYTAAMSLLKRLASEGSDHATETNTAARH